MPLLQSKMQEGQARPQWRQSTSAISAFQSLLAKRFYPILRPISNESGRKFTTHCFWPTIIQNRGIMQAWVTKRLKRNAVEIMLVRILNAHANDVARL